MGGVGGPEVGSCESEEEGLGLVGKEEGWVAVGVVLVFVASGLPPCPATAML